MAGGVGRPSSLVRIQIIAVGRLKPGPERTLVDDYSARFSKLGRSMGFSALTLSEIDERKAQTKEAQAELIQSVVPAAAMLWACDEHGSQSKSEDFAKDLRRLADQGLSDLAFVIGGADGLGPKVLGKADRTLSFGKMVWPHMLVRVMLTEQLYRAATIIAGAPYHRA